MGIADMTIGEIAKWAVGALVALSAIIQISPIKLNPWSWIAKKVGRAINGEVIQRMDKLEKDVGNMANQMAERDATNARTKILCFGDELRRGVQHSKDSFDDILTAIDSYEEYCRAHENFKNNVTAHTVKRIQDVYDECFKNNSFLQ